MGVTGEGIGDGTSARPALKSGQLSAAHRGYAYQDLVAAYLLVRSLVERFEEVVVDRKVVDDDRFDDIEVTAAGVRIRRQVKSSKDATAALSFSDFNRAGSSLRLDRLVNTLTAEGPRVADEYRLSATWQPPCSTDQLTGLLVSSFDLGTFAGFTTRTFRLEVNAVWPQGGQPVFTPLQKTPKGTRILSREEFVRFCERFVIEVSLPPASLDLNAPGSLERLLLALLSDRVGIGRYPNADRRLEDVAARAIYIASIARTGGATLRPSDVALRLNLRTDFGRIAQAFPLDKSVLQERLPLRRRLRASILQGGTHLVIAGPGSGKSWMLTQLAEDLKQEGLVVARHYCFLEPGDELVERRVTTDVFIGNLLGELSDAFNACALIPPQVFAAGLEEFEAFLATAADADQRVVIIVDGLDHIARVRGASASLSDNETDIVERLATLNLTENVTLVIGSQPGDHLQPLRDGFSARIVEHGVDPWSRAEMLELGRSHGIDAALDSAQLLEECEREPILDLLYKRSEGNPLYGRYLSRGLAEGLVAGVIEHPLDWLNATPVILGDIARYYSHLYESISNDAKAIADIVGVLEFSVTEEELTEIVGATLADWVTEALRAMSPVLSVATAQGGLRIFHESFRRFMLHELQRRGRHLSNVLAPVVAWLEARDFFADVKSFRFTLPVMRRAGRETEIVQRVSTSFVQLSLQNGHAHDAIERNLELAAEVAARTLNWSVLVRCAELSRALDMCFAVGTNEWPEYWKTYEAVFGHEALADRLLFDGQPTQPRNEGLLACERIDVVGGTAPWREYLALPLSHDEDGYALESDPLGDMSEDERLLIAVIRGRLRLGQTYQVVRRVQANLLASNTDISSLFLRKLAKLLATEISPEFVEKLTKRADFTPPKRYILQGRSACALLLGLADLAAEADDVSLATARATAALVHATSPEEAVWCAERGASAESALAHARPLVSLDIAVAGERGIVNAPSVRKWVASVRLLSRCESAASAIADERERLRGDGWYRCWLRFVLAAAQAESAATQGAPYDIKAVFSELVFDTRPFAGSPRACDLYAIHGLITQSIRGALRLSRSTDEWQHALNAISATRFGTTTRLDREDGGPITAGAYFSMLMRYASVPTASVLIVKTLEQELLEEEGGGTYYSNHANYRMRLARLHAEAGNRSRTLEHWCEACVFLLGYGFHKDRGLFDIIESAPVLYSVSGDAAFCALDRLQPLLSSVLHHTDGRETKHAPNAWFRALLKVDPVRAVELLCREFNRELGQISWIAEEALQDVLCELRDVADPMLLDTLWETLLLDIEYENAGAEVADRRLHPLERLMPAHAEHVRERVVRLCAEIVNDARRYREDAVARLQSFARMHGLVLPCVGEVSERRDRPIPRERTFLKVSSSLSPFRQPVFEPTPRFVDILTTLRRLPQQKAHETQAEAISLPLSYLITEMVDRGEEAQAQRLLKFLVHDIPYWSFEKVNPIALLAQSLDNAGHIRLAALALTLTFTSARGGGGYLNLGGREQTPTLRRAIQLDRDLALQTLAEETSRKVRLGGFSGVTKHLVEQISDWGDHAMAAQAWEEGFAVLASRLPLPVPQKFFEPFDPGDTVSWSVDEALATLLLSRIGNAVLPRKVAALSGFAQLLQERPDLFPFPLEWFLTRDSTVSSVQSVFQMLMQTPANVEEIVLVLEPLLKEYAHSKNWTLSWLAERLLARAGRPFSVTRTRSNVPVTGSSKEGVAVTAYADVDDVLDDLHNLWSDLPTIVAQRMDSLTTGNEHFKHYAKERAELTFGRSRYNPPAAVLSWPTELFISVLDETLMGLYQHLWKHGLWSPGIEDEVADRILPNVCLHLALNASRVPRPDWPPADNARDQISDIVRVSDDDSVYSAWLRLALHEQQFLNADGRDYSQPDKLVLRCAAVVRTELGGTVPERATPLPPGDISSCWQDMSARKAMIDARSPQLVKVDGVTDWLGRNVLLVPPLALLYRAGLQPPAPGTPLRWCDGDGKPAVVLRAWRVRGRGSDTEGHVTLGCDLLMRPDLLEVLERAYEGGPFKELQRVESREIRMPGS